jgi:aspartyl-tRNA(Asn)/glutamyl-tRNA(Gln) amidotransferase subunit A
MAMNQKELAHAEITEIAPLIQSKEISPVELVDLSLSRIAELDSTINAFIHVFEDEARAVAKAHEQEIMSGAYRGPLHGIPIGIKDIYETGPTTCGSKTLDGYIAEDDCFSVKKLKQAGAIVMGKTGTYEFAYGTPTLETHFPPTRNAWNTDFECGGSSSGTAGAIAAGLTYAGMGSCTGGSIRWPAQCCGHVGLKHTYGRVSRRGVYPLSQSLDHAGPLARTVQDSAHMLQGCAGFDPLDPGSADVAVPDFSAKIGRDIQGMRFGVMRDLYEDSAAPAVKKAFETALGQLEKMGAHIVDVPSISLEELLAFCFPLMWADAAAIHAQNLKTRADDYGRHTKLYLLWGLCMSNAAYQNGLRVRAQVRDQQLAALTTTADVLIVPTVGFQTPHVQEHTPGLEFLSASSFPFYTPIFNHTGLPAIQVPCGFDDDHMPVGLQIAGKPFDEQTIIQAAYAYEQEAGWVKQRPDL